MIIKIVRMSLHYVKMAQFILVILFLYKSPFIFLPALVNLNCFVYIFVKKSNIFWFFLRPAHVSFSWLKALAGLGLPLFPNFRPTGCRSLHWWWQWDWWNSSRSKFKASSGKSSVKSQLKTLDVKKFSPVNNRVQPSCLFLFSGAKNWCWLLLSLIIFGEPIWRHLQFLKGCLFLVKKVKILRSSCRRWKCTV